MKILCFDAARMSMRVVGQLSVDRGEAVGDADDAFYYKEKGKKW